MGVASLVLGLASLIVGLFIHGWIGLAAGIVGIILGAMGRKKGEGSIATAGMVISIIAVVLIVICVIIIATFLATIF